jgi:hypothetical protein
MVPIHHDTDAAGELEQLIGLRDSYRQRVQQDGTLSQWLRHIEQRIAAFQVSSHDDPDAAYFEAARKDPNPATRGWTREIFARYSVEIAPIIAEHTAAAITPLKDRLAAAEARIAALEGRGAQ